MALIEAGSRKPVLDLRGPDGNAFALLGYTRDYGRQLSWTSEKIKAIQSEMTSGNYKNLVETFDREFGEVIDLILPEGGL